MKRGRRLELEHLILLGGDAARAGDAGAPDQAHLGVVGKRLPRLQHDDGRVRLQPVGQAGDDAASRRLALDELDADALGDAVDLEAGVRERPTSRVASPSSDSTNACSSSMRSLPSPGSDDSIAGPPVEKLEARLAARAARRRGCAGPAAAVKAQRTPAGRSRSKSYAQVRLSTQRAVPCSGQSTVKGGATSRRSPNGTIGAEKRAVTWRTGPSPSPCGENCSTVTGLRRRPRPPTAPLPPSLPLVSSPLPALRDTVPETAKVAKFSPRVRVDLGVTLATLAASGRAASLPDTACVASARPAIPPFRPPRGFFPRASLR